MTLNILIVEDNQTKRLEIEKSIKSSMEADVIGASSIRQAYSSLEHKRWDLIVLDMTFQVTQSAGHESAKEALAGIEILQFISRRQIETPVVVATQHSSFSSLDMPGIDSVQKLDDLLRDLFPENYRSVVEVDLSEETWKFTLQREIISALKKA